jgi:hypothetical protein
LPRSLLKTSDEQQFFEYVSKEIAKQVEDNPHVTNIDKLANVPIEAQVIYWLWLFQCEAGYGGFDAFILDHLGVYSPQIHAALTAVGAHELVHRLEAAISHAVGRPTAEFTKLPDQTWFQQFSPVPEYPTLESVNKGFYPVVLSLTDRVVEYVRSNASVLFQLDAPAVEPSVDRILRPESFGQVAPGSARAGDPHDRMYE